MEKSQGEKYHKPRMPFPVKLRYTDEGKIKDTHRSLKNYIYSLNYVYGKEEKVKRYEKEC